MASSALIDDATVTRLLAPRDVLAVIDRAFLDPLEVPERLATEVSDPNGGTRTLLTMPALRPGGIAIVKIVHVRRGAGVDLSSHLLAFDRKGAALATIEAHSLTALRTAAASVLAAQALRARPARRSAIIGAGRQARAQLAAFVSAMPIERVSIWARRPAAAEAMVEAARALGVAAVASATPAEAVRDADLVSCATGSCAPLVRADDLAPHAHIDLVGGFRPNMREADDALIADAMLVADTPAALREAGDLAQPIADGVVRADRVHLLADLLRAGDRPRTEGRTLFKSVGHAGEDLVAVELLLERLGLAPPAENHR